MLTLGMIRPAVAVQFLFFSGILAAQSANPNRPNAPEKLQPPADQTVLLRTHAKGNQLYTCEAPPAWHFKAPQAELFDENGNSLGHHFSGPTWRSNDGSEVVGKVVASAPSPDAASVPWLLLTAVSHKQSGAFTAVVSIQRVNTKGGIAPKTACTANAEIAVPYEADYYFYAAKP